ncbi:hypothetical protein DdX_07244 [Ditylenchus destructor]|uniref:Uncharacterized protein n=1 Tax=Ditylenchus destructor TaxID=166010 RepID=A0AAD4N488_9BILA|nr:hypothetical protein DdX_07244 [Ditylenchus destructor]
MSQGTWKDVSFEEEEYGAVLEEEDQLNRLHFQREQEREGARKQQKRQAEQMLQESAKRNAPISVGQTVRIPIPSVDRAKTDPRNLLGVVKEEEDGFYRIGTDHGILSQQYSRNQIEPSSSQFISKENVQDKEISLRAAVGADSLNGGQRYKHCNCLQGCKTGKCNCRFEGKVSELKAMIEVYSNIETCCANDDFVEMDVGKETWQLFKVMRTVYFRDGTLTPAIRFLRGPRDKTYTNKVREMTDDEAKLFGAGQSHSAEWWKKLCQILGDNEFLVQYERKKQRYQKHKERIKYIEDRMFLRRKGIGLSEKAIDWYKSNSNVLPLDVPKAFYEANRDPRATAISTVAKYAPNTDEISNLPAPSSHTTHVDAQSTNPTKESDANTTAKTAPHALCPTAAVIENDAIINVISDGVNIDSVTEPSATSNVMTSTIVSENIEATNIIAEKGRKILNACREMSISSSTDSQIRNETDGKPANGNQKTTYSIKKLNGIKCGDYKPYSSNIFGPASACGSYNRNAVTSKRNLHKCIELVGRENYDLLDDTLKQDAIEKNLNIFIKEVAYVLSACASLGFPLHLDSLEIDREMIDTVRIQIESIGGDISSLSALRKKFEIGNISESQLQVIVSILEREYGLQQRNENWNEEQNENIEADKNADDYDNGVNTGNMNNDVRMTCKNRSLADDRRVFKESQRFGMSKGN